MERIKLNLIPSGVAPIVHLSQYDDGRQFGIDLFEGESVYVLDGTETLTVNSRKPDGHVVTLSVTNTGTSSLDVDTIEQLTAVHGVSYAKLKIEKGSVTIATLPFLIDVSRDPLENGDPSESFVDNLQTQIALAVADQYDSANVVFDANPTAGHGIGYAVTSEGVKTALDNLPIPDELNDLSDVDISGQAQGEALVWDGTKWVNGTVSTVGNLDDLNDVDTTGKATGDSLRYNGVEWIAQPTTVEMTQAEYNAIVDFTPYANTHIVITDAPNLNPTASDIEYSSGVTVKDELDDKLDIADLPMWVKQTSGQSLTLQVPFTFFYYYADQWNAHIPLPFIAKNTTYSISLTEVIAENIGNITAKCSVQSKTNTFFDIQTTRTMTALPDTFSTCVGRCKFTITFA